MKHLFLIGLLFFLPAAGLFAQNNGPAAADALIDAGKFSEAELLISRNLQTEKDPLQIREWNFRRDLMQRIRLDFNKSEAQVLEYVHKYLPKADKKDLAKWEKAGKLEFRLIDGQKNYFSRTASNLFRVDAEAKAAKIKITGDEPDSLSRFLLKEIPLYKDYNTKFHSRLGKPVRIKLDYSLSVKPDAVPAGEIVRVWIPYPKEVHARQKLISFRTEEENYVISPVGSPHRSFYAEKRAQAGQPTVFNVQYEIENRAEIFRINPDEILAYDTDSEFYKKYTSERDRHLVFSPEVKKLAEKIVGNESNPYKKVQKIFAWIDQNVPWAGALEYSVHRNIPAYCINNGWGDCGIKAMTLITLCRYVGVPAKWQSGWMVYPGNLNLHDWSEIYFEGYGWVPADPDFFSIPGKELQDFYLGGTDPYRWIVNDDFSADFYPAKIFPRSETVDFQRGEAEWRGGNLYFNQWSYNLKTEYVTE